MYDPEDRIEDGMNVGHSAVAIDSKIRDVALRTTDLREDGAPLVGKRRFFVCRRGEVVQEIKLKEIDEARRDFVPMCWVGAWWGFDSILHAVQPYAGRSRNHVPCTGVGEIRVDRLQPHLGVQRADGDFT